ncbi:putative uncharacterized transmembrane protein DDB_G0290641 [Drosophila subobscura]|uniref:putative uncharacterized transmembrane protein DDB_G0290641 n=1 Tax=Drosophila subobscura TaxID=7241 RepID=UPI00155B3D87|nr:putative uncharacterized transmembrane protein DDB_G0290641 [Drosophila subobscura]
MRSIAFAVVIFVGILAYSNAAPQINLGNLAWLENILRGLGSQNSTIRFGNNTLIVSGVSTASANVNPSQVEPHRHNHHTHPLSNYPGYGYGYGGYWRMVPSVDGKIIGEPENSQSYESNDFAFEDETVEGIIEEDQSDEDHSFSDASSEAEDELGAEADEDQLDQEDLNESMDEEVDPEEEAADKELDDAESELPAEKTN